MPNYWIVKTEPYTYSSDDLARQKTAVWDRVRNNPAARNNGQPTGRLNPWAKAISAAGVARSTAARTATRAAANVRRRGSASAARKGRVPKRSGRSPHEGRNRPMARPRRRAARRRAGPVAADPQ